IMDVALALHDLTLFDLHSRDLASAEQDLVAVIGMAALHRQSGTLGDQMTRSTIAGWAVDAIWNALQAPGWAEAQLARFQTDLERLSFIKEAEQSCRAERAMDLYWIGALRRGDSTALTTFGSPARL